MIIIKNSHHDHDQNLICAQSSSLPRLSSALTLLTWGVPIIKELKSEVFKNQDQPLHLYLVLTIIIVTHRHTLYTL